MRWSQTVRFNIAHDNRKTDISDLYGVGDIASLLGGEGIKMAATVAGALVLRDQPTAIIFEEGDGQQQNESLEQAVCRKISDAVNAYTNRDIVIQNEAIIINALRDGDVLNPDAYIELTGVDNSKIKLKASTVPDIPAFIQLTSEPTNDGSPPDFRCTLNNKSLVFENNEQQGVATATLGDSLLSFEYSQNNTTLYHAIGPDGFQVTSTKTESNNNIQNSCTVESNAIKYNTNIFKYGDDSSGSTFTSMANTNASFGIGHGKYKYTLFGGKEFIKFRIGLQETMSPESPLTPHVSGPEFKLCCRIKRDNAEPEPEPEPQPESEPQPEPEPELEIVRGTLRLVNTYKSREESQYIQRVTPDELITDSSGWDSQMSVYYSFDRFMKDFDRSDVGGDGTIGNIQKGPISLWKEQDWPIYRINFYDSEDNILGDQSEGYVFSIGDGVVDEGAERHLREFLLKFRFYQRDDADDDGDGSLGPRRTVRWYGASIYGDKLDGKTFDNKVEGDAEDITAPADDEVGLVYGVYVGRAVDEGNGDMLESQYVNKLVDGEYSDSDSSGNLPEDKVQCDASGGGLSIDERWWGNGQWAGQWTSEPRTEGDGRDHLGNIADWSNTNDNTWNNEDDVAPYIRTSLETGISDYQIELPVNKTIKWKLLKYEPSGNDWVEVIDSEDTDNDGIPYFSWSFIPDGSSDKIFEWQGEKNASLVWNENISKISHDAMSGFTWNEESPPEPEPEALYPEPEPEPEIPTFIDNLKICWTQASGSNDYTIYNYGDNGIATLDINDTVSDEYRIELNENGFFRIKTLKSDLFGDNLNKYWYRNESENIIRTNWDETSSEDSTQTLFEIEPIADTDGPSYLIKHKESGKYLSRSELSWGWGFVIELSDNKENGYFTFKDSDMNIIDIGSLIYPQEAATMGNIAYANVDDDEIPLEFSFLLNINVGSWLNVDKNTENGEYIDSDGLHWFMLSDIKTKNIADTLLSAYNIDAANIYYRREGLYIDIAWYPGTDHGMSLFGALRGAYSSILQYTLIQVA